MQSVDAANERAHEHLTELIESGEAYAFIGAGLSAGLYPLWDEAISIMMDLARETRLGQEHYEEWRKQASDYPLHVLDMIAEAQGRDRFLQALGDLFSPENKRMDEDFTDAHAVFIQQGFRGFVTTNYDESLIAARSRLRGPLHPDGACTWQDASWCSYWREGTPHKHADCPILFLHGRFHHRESLIATLVQYAEAYAKDHGPRPLLKQLWTREKLVVAGFSFSDPYFRHYLPTALREMAAPEAVRSANHVIIRGVDNPNDPNVADLRKKCREDYGADLLVYQVRRTEDGKEEHDEILSLMPQPTTSDRYAVRALGELS